MTPVKQIAVSPKQADALPIQPEAKVIESILQQAKIEPSLVAQKTPEPQKIKPVEVAKSEPMIPPVAQPPAPKESVDEEYLDNHLGAIRDVLVKYRKYPSQAVRLKQEGTTRVSFRLKSNGDIEDIVIQSSSGYEILDDDVKALIEKAAQYFPKPSKNVRITVSLSYGLKTK